MTLNLDDLGAFANAVQLKSSSFGADALHHAAFLQICYTH
eukprot:SAG31_NODE_1004_length_10437_cov_2.754208_8_plen_40_part_00